MRKTTFLVGAMVILGLGFQGNALAKPIPGKVASVNQRKKMIEFEYKDRKTRKKEKIEVYYNSKTKFSRMKSKDLKRGLPVIVDLTQDRIYKKWQAVSIKSTERKDPMQKVFVQVPYL